MLPPIAPMTNAKSLMRLRMKAERRAAAKKRPDAAIHAARNFFGSVELSDDAIVSLYYPIGDELDTEPIAAELTERNITIALPVVARKKKPLTFRAYRPGDPVIEGVYGEMIPDETAAEVTPTIMVCPLLGFSRAGGRLGYGGGYYDRTLAEIRERQFVTAVGYAFGAQEVDGLPLSPLDQPLDWIITEREAIRC